MINGLEGIPGSGKSYEAVAMHVLPALKAGRKVITNLPLLISVFAALDPAYGSLIELRVHSQPVLGIWDPEGIDQNGNGQAFKLVDQALSPPVQNVPVFGSVWDYYTDWKHPSTGVGPLFIIDESHLALPVSGTTQSVIEFYKLHRHFNVDVLLATQSFRDINQPIARLIAILIKCRKADILGHKDEYIRKVHSGYRGAVISTEMRKYQPAYFKLYRSHTQGNGVAESSASDVSPFIVKFRRFTRVFIALTLAYCIYAGWRFYHKPVSTVTALPVASVITNAVAPLATASAAASPLVSTPVGQTMLPTAPGVVPEPYATKGIHVSGRMTLGARTLYMFALSVGSTRIGSVSSDDLKTVGYEWQPLTDCAGVLRWKGTAKTVTCDAPAVPEGSFSNPVVITLPAGSVTPSARSDGRLVATK